MNPRYVEYVKRCRAPRRVGPDDERTTRQWSQSISARPFEPLSHTRHRDGTGLSKNLTILRERRCGLLEPETTG
jgi:hypothetical protein